VGTMALWVQYSAIPGMGYGTGSAIEFSDLDLDQVLIPRII
jgi:hypothetical protein